MPMRRPTPLVLLAAGALALWYASTPGDLIAARRSQVAWSDSVSYRLPDDPETKARTTRAVGWLKRHTVTFARPGEDESIPVIAWKDPTLDPGEPKVLVGYLITDTLWAAKAIKPLDPEAAAAMERGLQRLGSYGNGLQDVLFHPIDRMLHRPADSDFVHGHSLGRFPIDGGRSVDVRDFLQKWDAAFEVGHPARFAEHAAYQAIHDFWNGRKEESRRRILGVVKDDRADPDDAIFWGDRAEVLIDFASQKDWLRFQGGERPTYPNCSFKLGVLLYAIRLMGLETDDVIAPRLEKMRRRLWSAQADDGGIAHFVHVGRDGEVAPRVRGATGEATAIAILSETVQSVKRARRGSSSLRISPGWRTRR